MAAIEIDADSRQQTAAASIAIAGSSSSCCSLLDDLVTHTESMAEEEEEEEEGRKHISSTTAFWKVRPAVMLHSSDHTVSSSAAKTVCLRLAIFNLQFGVVRAIRTHSHAHIFGGSLLSLL